VSRTGSRRIPALMRRPSGVVAGDDFDPIADMGWERFHRGGDWTTTGSEIDEWTDLSGNGNHATGATNNTNKPTAGTLGGQDAADFTPVTQGYFSLPSLAAISTAGVGWVWAVMQLDADPQPSIGSAGVWVLGSHGADDLISNATTGDALIGPLSTTRPNTGDPTTDRAVPHTISVLSAASDFEVWVNNTSHYSSGTNTVGVAASPELGKSVSRYFNGLIAELGILDREPSAAEMAAMQAYAVARYGIT